MLAISATDAGCNTTLPELPKEAQPMAADSLLRQTRKAARIRQLADDVGELSAVVKSKGTSGLRVSAHEMPSEPPAIV